MLIPDRMFSLFRTSARGLEAQRMAMGTATENLANATTSWQEGDDPYQVKRAVHNAPEGVNERFATLITNRSQDLRAVDGRHMTGSTLDRQNLVQDLGPETEIQGEDRVRLAYDPTHPHADAQGYVRYADVNVVEEMARMISSNRIYEANLTAVEAAKEMVKRTLEI